MIYESSPEAVEGFERKFEEMWGRASNTSATLAERETAALHRRFCSFLSSGVAARDRSSSASQPLVSSHWEVDVLKRQNNCARYRG